MKKAIFLFLFVLIFLNLSGQISLTNQDTYKAGDVIPQIKYNSPSDEGTAFISLYDELIFDDLDWSDEIDSLYFYDKSEYDFDNTFPDANCTFIAEQGFIMFLEINENYIKALGIQAEIPFLGETRNVRFATPLDLYSFPCEYEFQHSSTGTANIKNHISAYQQIIPEDNYEQIVDNFDTVKMEIRITNNSYFDEFGVLSMVGKLLLNGDFNYLRERKLVISHSDLYLRNIKTGMYFSAGKIFGYQLPVELPIVDSTFSLLYWTKNQKYPIAEFDMNMDYKNIYQAKFRYEDKTEINDFFTSTITSFPNPTNDFIYFDLQDNNKNLIINIFSLNGQLLKSLNVEDSKIIKYDVSQLSSGLYFYQIKDSSGKYINQGKFFKAN
jgi:hypothetical protein